ncbi:hypothetical protein [Acinetobacter sp. ANC 4648]|uniref:hypothetical protein n=1 Tax=Acinetobacter sp. ANC 4648 TaxID=1977875 RepID=UPI000A33C961|nr:hypothetical protein [Acinetobacter sp. ANC 4648]OTG82283.1 hypothetical protein B9T27_08530 [Acinetobacter sp. ANC 4648]
MSKNFKAETYVVDDHLSDTLTWLCQHQDCFDSFEYDALHQQLKVHHANGVDVIRVGMFLNAQYGILITSL